MTEPVDQQRKWVFTVNNYTEDDTAAVKAIDCLRIKAGFEVCPTTGTPHIQGAVVFKHPRSLNAVKRDLGGRAHMEIMKGTWGDQKYCTKDGNILRDDDYSTQGQRNDLVNFRDALKRGADDFELLEDHLREFAKYPRMIGMARCAVAKKMSREFRKLEVIAMWGPPGTNKTRRGYDEGAYVFDDYEDGWWDGYMGEETIVLDEFYGGIKYSKLLKLLDGYQHRLKVKGGFTYARWTKVYITSNKEPTEWYSHGLTAALKRRITQVLTYHDGGWLDQSDMYLN